MVDYSVQLDDSQVQKKFRRLIKKNPTLSRDILSFISEAVVNRTVRHHLSGQTLKRQTGTLAKSINYKLQNDYVSKVGSNVVYAPIHEFGGEIRPVNAKALTFKVKDQWVTTQKVNMPARPYLRPALDYVMENESKEIMNKRIDIFLEKEWLDE